MKKLTYVVPNFALDLSNLYNNILHKRVELLPPVETTAKDIITQVQPVDETSQNSVSKLVSKFRSFMSPNPNPVETTITAKPITNINFDSNTPIAESIPVAQSLDNINANIMQSLDNVPIVRATPMRPTGQYRSNRSPRNRHIINENIGGGAPPEFYE